MHIYTSYIFQEDTYPTHPCKNASEKYHRNSRQTRTNWARNGDEMWTKCGRTRTKWGRTVTGMLQNVLAWLQSPVIIASECNDHNNRRDSAEGGDKWGRGEWRMSERGFILNTWIFEITVDLGIRRCLDASDTGCLAENSCQGLVDMFCFKR